MTDEEKVTQQSENPDVWEDEPLLPDETPDADTPSEPGNADAPETTENPDTPSEPEKADIPEAGDTGAQGPKGDAAENPEAPPEPDYKALYEGEQERRNAERYRQVYQEQLSLSGNEALARMVARNECGGKDYPLEDAPAAPSTDFRDALKELQALYSDATEMPASVMKDFMGGKSLKESYAAHRAKQDAETIRNLQREIAVLKKNDANRAAAPVKGSNGAPPEQPDPFMTGFDKEW